MKKVFIALLSLISMTGYAQQKSINQVLNDNIRKENATALTITMPSEEEMPKFIGSGDVIYQLTTEPKNVNNPQDEFFVDNTDNIYPGAIVFANKDLANGDPTLAGLGYGKVTVSVDFNTGGSGSRSGVTNSPDGIRKAINEILNEAASNGKKSSITFQYNASSNTSLASMVANFNVSASFLKAKAKVNTTVSSKEISVTDVEEYKQPYYTVTITQEADKSKYFASNVTGNAIEAKMKQFGNAPLAIISSVTYGRRVYHFKEFSSSDFMFKGNQSASGYGQSLRSNQDITKKSTAKKEWIYVTGSDKVTSGGILGGKSVKKAMEEKVYFDPQTDQAVPIAYKVIFLGSGKTAKVSTTGSYKEVTEYTPCFKNIYIEVKKHATQVAATGMRFRVDYKAVHVKRDASGKIIDYEKWDSPKVKGTYEGYADYRQWKMEKGDTKKTLMIPTSDLPDYKNCYVYGELHYQIRAQTSAGADQETRDQGEFTPTSARITAHIDGSNYLGKSLKIRMENQ